MEVSDSECVRHENVLKGTRDCHQATVIKQWGPGQQIVHLSFKLPLGVRLEVPCNRAERVFN
eukprot:2816496-Amphidinium_carterae.2